MTGSKSPIVKKPLPIDDPRKRQPDIELARIVLGFNPKIDLDTGLNLTIEYFRQNL
jgi:nucleoside-diphosphate-sugar epimerase